MEPVRAFIALPLPEALNGELEGLMGALHLEKRGFKTVPVASIHLTLKFLGGLPPELFEAVGAAVGEGFELGGPLKLNARGVGFFPGPRTPKVAWVGVGGDTARLGRLFMEVEHRLSLMGIPREARLFKPHLTLGRARGEKPPKKPTPLPEEAANWSGSPWSADEIVLYESKLQPQGALHIPRARGSIK